MKKPFGADTPPPLQPTPTWVWWMLLFIVLVIAGGIYHASH